MLNHEIASEILSNMGDEAHAQAGYELLIDAMEKAGCDESDIETIKEIQGDERNHALKLFNMAQKYNNVKTSNDARVEILTAIADGFSA